MNHPENQSGTFPARAIKPAATTMLNQDIRTDSSAGCLSTHEQSQLLAHLYSGTTEYGHWSHFLRALATAFSSVNCSLATLDATTGKPIVQYTSHAFDHVWYDRYTTHYAAVSPLRPVLFKHHNMGRVMTCQQIMAPQDFENSEFYLDYLAKYGIRYVMGAAFKVGEGISAYIALHRGRNAGAFEAVHSDALQTLIPHLSAAYRIRTQFIGMGRYEELSQQYLDAKSKGLVCIDRHGRIVSMNHEAERIFSLNDGLTYMQGHFLTLSRNEDLRLQHLLAHCCLAGRSGTADLHPDATGGTMTLPRTGRKPPYNLWIFPILGRNTRFEDNQIVAAIEIADPLTRQTVQANTALSGYNLTRAESRLAEALIQGGQLKDIAGRFEVSVNTLKVQRRSLYRKIGARRHFDLIAMVRQDA